MKIETKRSILRLIKEAEEQFAGTGKALLDIEDYVAEYLTANGVTLPYCKTEGAIIVGYQGIGKSTLAKNVNGYIDLESGNFWINGKRADDWYIPYCNIAVHLAEQGYKVFVSSHAVVREQLASLYNNVPLLACFPSYSLKNTWITKLQIRYEKTQLEKDYKAWKNAEERYDENIKELHEATAFIPVVISHKYYILDSLIEEALKGVK